MWRWCSWPAASHRTAALKLKKQNYKSVTCGPHSKLPKMLIRRNSISHQPRFISRHTNRKKKTEKFSLSLFVDRYDDEQFKLRNYSLNHIQKMPDVNRSAVCLMRDAVFGTENFFLSKFHKIYGKSNFHSEKGQNDFCSKFLGSSGEFLTVEGSFGSKATHTSPQNYCKFNFLNFLLFGFFKQRKCWKISQNCKLLAFLWVHSQFSGVSSLLMALSGQFSTSQSSQAHCEAILMHFTAPSTDFRQIYLWTRPPRLIWDKFLHVYVS